MACFTEGGTTPDVIDELINCVRKVLGPQLCVSAATLVQAMTKRAGYCWRLDYQLTGVRH